VSEEEAGKVGSLLWPLVTAMAAGAEALMVVGWRGGWGWRCSHR
jgi:hypothetical protein